MSHSTWLDLYPFFIQGAQGPRGPAGPIGEPGAPVSCNLTLYSICTLFCWSHYFLTASKRSIYRHLFLFCISSSFSQFMFSSFLSGYTRATWHPWLSWRERTNSKCTEHVTDTACVLYCIILHHLEEGGGSLLKFCPRYLQHVQTTTSYYITSCYII